METKSHSRKNHLTLGEFIESVYDGCGKRKARKIVQFACKAHLIHFKKSNPL